MGDNKHESQSVSLWVQGKEGSRQCLARENLQSEVGGRADESQSSRAGPLVTNAKENQSSKEEHSGVELSGLSSGLEPA